MELVVGAKSTKPGSKATSRKANLVNGKPPRVPVGALHLIDMQSQSTTGAMFTAVCGESALVSVDGDWSDEFANERCDVCSDRQWMSEFDDMQSKLLPK